MKNKKAKDEPRYSVLVTDHEPEINSAGEIEFDKVKAEAEIIVKVKFYDKMKCMRVTENEDDGIFITEGIRIPILETECDTYAFYKGKTNMNTETVRRKYCDAILEAARRVAMEGI